MNSLARRIRCVRPWFLMSLLLLVAGGCGTTGAGGTNSAGSDSSALEQLALELVNRARLRPAAEAALAGVGLNEGVPADEQISTNPKQALAMNTSLTQAARQHGQDMLTRNYFEHNTPEGTTPFQRINAAGYLYAAAGENLAWRGTTGPLDEAATTEQEHIDLFVDAGVSDRGHRTTMLQAVFREVGIGIVRGNYTDGGTRFDALMQTQDYGTPTNAGTFVLGVVYNDGNANGRYDYGEGVANVGVTLGGTSKTTNAGGGYGFEVRAAGTYLLRFAPGPGQNLTINSGSLNIKADLVNSTDIVINLGLGIL